MQDGPAYNASRCFFHYLQDGPAYNHYMQDHSAYDICHFKKIFAIDLW